LGQRARRTHGADGRDHGRLAGEALPAGPVRPPVHPFPPVGPGLRPLLHEISSELRILPPPAVPAGGPGPHAVAEGIRREEAERRRVLRHGPGCVGDWGKIPPPGKWMLYTYWQ